MDYENYKHIMDMEIQSNDNLEASEKETQIRIDNEGVSIYSDHRTGIRWCRQQIKENRAELDYYNTIGDKLVGIGIKTSYDLISLKSVPRKQKNISNCFSV